MQSKRYLAVIGFLLCLSACARQESAVGTPDTPLVMLLSPAYAQSATKDDLQGMAAFLQKETGFTVEVRVAKGAVEAIEAFGGGVGSADVGLLNLFEYVLAREEYGVQASLQVVRAGAFEYAGEIVVKKDSGITNIKDLAGRKIAYVDPYSSSGFVFPAQLLAKEKIELITEFAGSPEKALEKLKAGTVDAAAVYRGAIVKEPTLQVVTTTASIPNEPIFFRAGLAAQKKERLQAALQKFAASEEGGRILPKLAEITGLRPVSDAHYSELSQLITSSGRSASDLVQRGWEVNRPSGDLVP